MAADVFTRFSITGLELFAAVMATMTYRHYRDTPLKYFMPFLWLTVAVELFGYLRAVDYFFPDSMLIQFAGSLMPEHLYQENIWLYNIYAILSRFVFIFYFYKTIPMRSYKRYTVLLMVLLFCFASIGIFLTEDLFSDRIQIVYSLGSLLVMTAILLYYDYSLKYVDIFQMFRTTSFLVSLGILGYILITVPIYVFSKRIMASEYYSYINFFCNLWMYGLFIKGFIASSRVSKSLA